jgi:hypothetical protein
MVSKRSHHGDNSNHLSKGSKTTRKLRWDKELENQEEL